jgi:hypothetical protein
MFYIAHMNGSTLAAKAPEGELVSPRYATEDMFEACAFSTWGEASEASQNFGLEWSVEEI